MTMDFEGGGLFDDDDDLSLYYLFLAGGTGVMMYLMGVVMSMAEPRAKSVFDVLDQRLEIFVINERLRLSGQQSPYKVGDKAVHSALSLVGCIHQTNTDEGSVPICGNSAARQLMVQRVKDMGLERPAEKTIPSNNSQYDYTYA
jgi:hypothetical protein